MCPFLCVSFFSYFSRGPANTNLVVLCGCKGTGPIHVTTNDWLRRDRMMKPALSNERMSREQCEPTTDVAKPNSAIPQTTPLEILTLSKREWLFIFLICVWESEDRLIPCGVLWIWWGGIRSRRRNNDNKERKKRKKERTKKKILQRLEGTYTKNKTKTSKDEGRTTSYWRYFIVYQHHKNHQNHVHHHCHPDPSCLVVQHHHHRQRPLRQQWSLNWKKEKASVNGTCSHSIKSWWETECVKLLLLRIYLTTVLWTTTKLLPLPLLLHTTIRRQ